MEQMTFLDFFAGIGGFRKGFELCGMRCVGHCEIDKYADRSYRAIHDVKEDEWYAADITKVAPSDLPRAALWAGGCPCQDISVAGRQRPKYPDTGILLPTGLLWGDLRGRLL